jgi:hypothetical protein
VDLNRVFDIRDRVRFLDGVLCRVRLRRLDALRLVARTLRETRIELKVNVGSLSAGFGFSAVWLPKAWVTAWQAARSCAFDAQIRDCGCVDLLQTSAK